jgi:hypothetical protein
MVLTNFPSDSLLDLPPWSAQRKASFRFELADRVSGLKLGDITPIRTATLSHNTTRLVKRQLTIALGVTDTTNINPVSDMVSVFMTFPSGAEYPLGKYIFTDASYQLFTSGRLSNMVLNDFMYLVNQQIEKGFSALTLVGTVSTQIGSTISNCVSRLVEDLPIQVKIEASPFLTVQTWAPGATKGSIFEEIALTGDYFSPWFDNDGFMKWIRSFDPALVVPDFDWDAGNQVTRANLLSTSNVLTAPNRFVVISNNPIDPNIPTFGSANVPVTAPNSIQNRGFVIPKIVDMQALDTLQCNAIAANLVQRQTIFETMNVVTAADPRHDSYNVVHWQGDLWLELAWDLPLKEGAAMGHTLRKSYR